MSSKMHAGLVAGGFGAALAISLSLSSLLFPVAAAYLALALLFGLGVVSGVLAERWLDLTDYGRQQAAGAIAGLVAAGVTEVADLVLRLVFASLSKASPTTALANVILLRIPAPSDAARLIFVILINLLLYLLYLLIVIGISSAVASVAGRGKTVDALETLLEKRRRPLLSEADDEIVDPLAVDPALLPFMRPEYSPFVPEEPPVPVPLWQQRRLEREALPPTRSTPLPRKSSPLPRNSSPLPRNSSPLPGRSAPLPAGEGRQVERQRQPPEQDGPPAPRRRASGSLYPPGPPARGPISGPVQPRPPSGSMQPRSPSGPMQRRPTSGLRPPPNAQRPQQGDKK
jgi:hypothetical protein